MSFDFDKNIKKLLIFGDVSFFTGCLLLILGIIYNINNYIINFIIFSFIGCIILIISSLFQATSIILKGLKNIKYETGEEFE